MDELAIIFSRFYLHKYELSMAVIHAVCGADITHPAGDLVNTWRTKNRSNLLCRTQVQQIEPRVIHTQEGPGIEASRQLRSFHNVVM